MKRECGANGGSEALRTAVCPTLAPLLNGLSPVSVARGVELLCGVAVYYRDVVTLPEDWRLPATERGGSPYGVSVREALAVPALDGATVLAGDDGFGRIVQRANVMEVPDILPWVKPYELLLTTGYPLRDTPDGLVRLVGDLAHRGLAAILIKPGRYIDELPAEMLAEADRHGLPIVELPVQVGSTTSSTRC